jgi:predicted nucleic acid-binding protein
MSDALVDASFLVALGYPRDRNHTKAVAFAKSQPVNLLIPDVVLVEVMFNLRRLGGVNATVRFADLLVSQKPQLLALTVADFSRSVEIMTKYRDSALDFVDCCLTALAERLNITRICTFDRRDFAMIRPAHIDYLELLP